MTKTKEVFIRRHAEPGYEVEFDWGEIKLFIDDKLKHFLWLYLLWRTVITVSLEFINPNPKFVY